MTNIARNDIGNADIERMEREIELLRAAVLRKSSALNIAQDELAAAYDERDQARGQLAEAQAPKLMPPVAEACRLLDIDPSNGYRLIKANRFPVPVRGVGHAMKVLRLELEDFARSAD